MKKFFIAAVMAVFLSVSSLFAADTNNNSWYVGGNVGASQSQVEVQSKVKDFRAVVGLEGGYIINPEWRSYLGYSYQFPVKDTQNGVDYKFKNIHQVVVGLDWTPKFVGATRGVFGAYTGYKVGKMVADSKTSDTFNGWVTGARAGFLIEAADNVETGVLVNVDKTWFGNSPKFDVKPQAVNYGAKVFVNFKF